MDRFDVIHTKIINFIINNSDTFRQNLPTCGKKRLLKKYHQRNKKWYVLKCLSKASILHMLFSWSNILFIFLRARVHVFDTSLLMSPILHFRDTVCQD
jgi:hypothetical protein